MKDAIGLIVAWTVLAYVALAVTTMVVVNSSCEMWAPVRILRVGLMWPRYLYDPDHFAPTYFGQLPTDGYLPNQVCFVLPK